jgi:hypothetical protein
MRFWGALKLSNFSGVVLFPSIPKLSSGYLMFLSRKLFGATTMTASVLAALMILLMGRTSIALSHG